MRAHSAIHVKKNRERRETTVDWKINYSVGLDKKKFSSFWLTFYKKMGTKMKKFGLKFVLPNGLEYIIQSHLIFHHFHALPIKLQTAEPFNDLLTGETLQ